MANKKEVEGAIVWANINAEVTERQFSYYRGEWRNG